MTESVLNNISIFDEKNRQNLPVLFLPSEKLGKNLHIPINLVY